MEEPRKDLVPVQTHSPVTISGLTPASPAMQAAASETSGLTLQRKVIALVIAVVSDAISAASAFAPPVQIAVDVVTGLLLFAVLGFRWPLLPVLVIEAIPGVAAFPTWMLAVGVLVGITPTAKPRT